MGDGGGLSVALAEGVTAIAGATQAVSIRLISTTLRWRNALRMRRITIDSLPGIVSMIFPSARLCQTQYDSKDQEGKEYILNRVDDDAHPGAAEAPARKCVEEGRANDSLGDHPGLVNMPEGMQHATC